MTERDRRYEGRNSDDERHVGFMTAAADVFETEHTAATQVLTPKATQPSSDDAEFERQMALGRALMRKHRNVLAALAK